MILLLFSSTAIALGILGLRKALRGFLSESDANRALGYAQGSYERRTLEGVRR
ncbi:hypothetical protein [Rhodococcus sp. 14-2496-1d]|uniref:hypothetical protein n=1 Tax=Rhodococcus sp. 14-2496-1d TaxID=2023146 RepID=UPI0015C5F350|nr:hypothetical protein [Rhodococcus sp. 14-2496-1d]